MHILFISSWFPSDDNPSFGSFVFEQARLLAQRGHRTEVVQPVLSGSAKQTWSQKHLKQHTFVYGGIPVQVIPVNVWLPGVKSWYYRLLYTRCRRALRSRFAETGTPDIIHSHAGFMGGVVAAKLARTFGIPLVHTEHSSGFIFDPKQYTATDRAWLRTLAAEADPFLFVSRYAQSASQERMGLTFKNSRVLPNMVNPLFFERLTVRNPQNRALCIANFSVLKNQLFLLEVWQRVVKEMPGLQLALAGNGFTSPQFLQNVQALGLTAHVQLLPRLNREEVKQALADSRLAVSASRVETFGLTLAEALATGIPVVATDSGGPQDIVLPGDGFLVPQDDADAFARAVLRIAAGEHDPPEEISARCKARFGQDMIYDQLMEIYRPLCP